MPTIAKHLTFHAQKIINIKTDEFYVEILSRLASSESHIAINLEEFFQKISLLELYEIFELQNTVADQLFQASGVKSSLNLDNRLLEPLEMRARVLEVITNAAAPTTYEFTETFPMPAAALINPILGIIRGQGKRSALDDFGTGFNGMSLFVDYDFDLVKIDRSLITDIDERPAKKKILLLIEKMIDSLGKSHVVEGVETRAQFDTLKECGFETFQGYLFHKPEPIEVFFKPSKTL